MVGGRLGILVKEGKVTLEVRLAFEKLMPEIIVIHNLVNHNVITKIGNKVILTLLNAIEIET